MARITFVTWSGGGNVPPAIGLAQALVARGHTVRFLGYRAQRAQISERGFAFDELALSGAFDARTVPAVERVRELTANVWACAAHLEDVPAALRAEPADVLLVDFLLQGALAAAALGSIPTVVLAHSAIAGLVPPPSSPLGGARLEAVNALRTKAPLPPLARLDDAWMNSLTLVTTIAELDLTDAGPHVRYVGPIAEEDRETEADGAPRPDERPLVVASFSTTGFWEQRGRMQRTLAALAELPVRVLVCGEEVASLGALPANATGRRFVSHARVMPSAALAIIHCGHGTLCAALRHGVPVLGLPNPAADQPFLAARVDVLGAGLKLDGEATVDDIRGAAGRILAGPSFAARARGLMAAIASSPGADGAAAMVETLT
jgi:MGT family glycosyltransferase